MARALTAQKREEWMAAMEARTAAAHAQLVEGVTRLAGREGWELVSMSDRHNNQKEAYFKRPKP